jgi:hypothetical protein
MGVSEAVMARQAAWRGGAEAQSEKRQLKHYVA